MRSPFTRPRKPLLAFAVAATGGILGVDYFPLAPLLLAGLALVGAPFLWRWPKPWLVAGWIAVVFGALHAFRVTDGPAAALTRWAHHVPPRTEAEGVVWSEPKAFLGRQGESLARFTLRLHTLRVGTNPAVNAPVFCAVHWVGPAPRDGDRVRVRGLATALQPPENPGEFHSADWQQRRGTAFLLTARNQADTEILGHGEGPALEAFANASRQWIKQRLEVGLEATPETALIESMVLGLQGETPPEMKEWFQQTGTLHLFAVSGLNVAMLAVMAAMLLRPWGLPRSLACLVSIPLLVAYGIVTGFGPSCARATVMAAFVLMGPVVDRPAVLLNSMGGAALTILAWDTNQLFQPGFQLSFILVLTIIALAEPISRRMTRWFAPDDFLPEPLWTRRQRWWLAMGRGVSQGIGVTVAAWLGSLPFTIGYFHLLSPVAILANAVAVPLAFIVLALGLLSLLVSVTPLLATVNAANWAMAKLLLLAVGWFAGLPGAYQYAETPRLVRAPAAEITVLAVGTGAATHVRADGKDWLLDTGATRDYEFTLLPYLRSRGVNTLEGILFTHGGSGHLGNVLPLWQDFAPRWLADLSRFDRAPGHRELHGILSYQRIGRRFPQYGEMIPLSPHASLKILYPPRDSTRIKTDDQALVCRLEAAGRRVLFMSDAGFATEQWLLANDADLRADVVVKGWHGSDFSGTADFLTHVRPQAVVCSAPSWNVAPAVFTEWARTTTALGIAIYPQAACGAVRMTIATDGGLQVQTWKR